MVSSELTRSSQKTLPNFRTFSHGANSCQKFEDNFPRLLQAIINESSNWQWRNN